MVSGQRFFTSRNPSPFVFALMALSVLPLVGEAQRTRINVQPPTGWFGIRISDQARVDEQGNAFFDSYPVITGVDSGSPAARAGVRPGDVLLAFNSHDMRGGSVELGKWLMAGAPFAVKIRRNGAPRVITGTLDRRPENWEQRMIVRLSVPEMMERQKGSIGRELMPHTGIIRARIPVPEPLPSVLPPALGYGGGVYPFAGAEFTALNEDLSDALGVKPEGVFVMNVIEGSAAKAAGLRGGDIVLKADTIKIESPIDLVRAIRSADETDQQVVLQIIRKRKPQALTLRW